MDVRATYREGAARGASSLGLVILLYEQVIQDLRRAGQAIDAGNIEARTNAVNHALDVLSQLQGTLNMQAGGAVAHNLERFYNLVRQKVFDAQCQPSKAALDEQIALLLDVRDAWVQAERMAFQPASPPGPASGEEAPGAASTHADWSG